MVYLFFYVSQFPEFQTLKLGEVPPSFKVVALNRAWVAIGDAGGRSNHSANTWWCQPGCLSWYAKASWTSWPTPKTKGSSKVSMVQRMSFHGFVSGESTVENMGFDMFLTLSTFPSSTFGASCVCCWIWQTVDQEFHHIPLSKKWTVTC